MVDVLLAVTGAIHTASATCIKTLDQWEVTVTWVEPDTSKDETMARKLQEKEFDGSGGAVRGDRGGDHVDGGTGCGDHGAISASLIQARNMWQEQTDAKFAHKIEQEQKDHEVALNLQAHFKGGHDSARAIRGGSAGHHGGAVRAGGHSHRGSVGHRGGAMWNEKQYQKNTQEEASYKIALQLLADDNGGRGGEIVDPNILALRRLPL